MKATDKLTAHNWCEIFNSDNLSKPDGKCYALYHNDAPSQVVNGSDRNDS